MPGGEHQMSNSKKTECNRETSIILTYKNKVVKTNNMFSILTGYDASTFHNLHINAAFKLIRINNFLQKSYNQGYCRLLIIDKHLKVKEIDLEYIENEETESRLYFIKEINNLNIDKNFENISKAYFNSNTGIAIYSLTDLSLLKANSQYLSLLNPPYNKADNAYGENINTVCFISDKGLLLDSISNCINTHDPSNIKEILSDSIGRNLYFDIDIIPIIIRSIPQYIILKVTNITQKIEYKNFVNEKYKIFNEFAIAVIRLSYPSFNILEITDKAVRMLSQIFQEDCIEINDVSYKSISTILYLYYIPKYIKYIEEMSQHKKSIHLSRHEVVKKSKTFYYNIIFQPVLDTTDNLCEFIFTLIDVTEEVEQEQSLKNAVKMKDEFLSFMSHEFKTPLNVIYSAVQAIEYLHKNELPTNSIKFIDKIHQNTLRQLRLVNTVLDISRSESGFLKQHMRNADIISMSASIIDSVSLYAEKKNIKIVFEPEYPSKVISIDDEKYERILLNLLSNAIKFTPSFKNIYVTIKSNHKKIYIEVKDEGIGIPSEKLDIIFDRFAQVDCSFTRNSEGTGIGLYLSKMLAIAMDGDITVESKEGIGSTFTLTLEDRLMPEEIEKNLLATKGDSRLIQTVAIEFSDIYSI